MARHARIVSLLTAAVVGVGLLSTVAVAQQTKGADAHGQTQYTGPLPPIRVTPVEVDFGTANPDNPIHISVKITNTAPQTIRIKEVRPTCKCTVPTLPKDVLSPGETIEVPLVIDLRGSLGKVRKPFDVFVEGWNRPFTAVVIGNLMYPIEVTPDDPQATRDRKGEVALRAVDGRPFEVVSVHGRPPQVVERKPDIGPRSLEWTVQWDMGHVQDWPYMMVIETDHPECEVLTVRFKGAIISQAEVPYIKNWPFIFVNRTNVNLGLIPPGGTVDFDVPVTRPDRTNRCEMSFSPSELTDTFDDAIRAEIVDVKPVDGRPDDEQYYIRVTNISKEPKTVCTPLYFSTKVIDPESISDIKGGAVRPDNGYHLSRCWIGGVVRGSEASAQAARTN